MSALHIALIFIAGLICGIGTIGVWWGLRLLADAKAAGRVAEAALNTLHGTVKDEEAQQAVKECKRRMRWQRNLNPQWVEPLIQEIPRLVREIASIYYPAEHQPLLAPGLSHFTRAVHLAALDIADFLQTRTIGRLVDVSANTAIKAINKGREVVESEHFQNINKWYNRLLPVWQLARVNSPVMWATLAVSNVAVRALQPAVVDIVARRTIELYSGRLAAGKTMADVTVEAEEEA